MTHSSRNLARLCAASLALSGVAVAAFGEETAFQYYEQSKALRAEGKTDAAIGALEQAHRLEPANAVIAFDLAYAYRAADRNGEAAKMFGEALALDPSRYAVIEDWAYALKAAGEREAAAAKFREVIDNKARYPQSTADERVDLAVRMERVRREIAMLERNWYANASFSYRNGAVGTSFAPTTDNSFSASQAGVEAGWQPLDKVRLQTYGRVLFAFKDDTLRYDDSSAQLGVGLRWRPFESQDFALSGERLIKAGSNARDAWLLRGSYFWGTGMDQDPIRDSWNFTSLYGDVAYIPGDRHYFSLYGEAMQGWRFKLAPDWALTPHAVFTATRTDDLGGIRHLAEAGAGVMLTHWYGADDYHGALSQVSLTVQYRAPVADNVGAGHVFAAKLIWNM